MVTEDELNRDAFLSVILVGSCPRCGSGNTHDCEAIHHEYDEYLNEITKQGSDCPAAKEIDDITIGHCDDCDYLWCLECGRKYSAESGACVHYSICEECGSENGYLDAGEFVEQVCPSCENRGEDGCKLGDSSYECVHMDRECPYGGRMNECPRMIQQANHDGC
jgi:hypothetical protein